jgi:L-threonylcarbamoyladenylate synthase
MGNPLVLHVDQMAPQEGELCAAASMLAQGGVAVIPTDSVYGICCAALEQNPGLERVFAIKERPRTQTLPLLVGSLAQFEELAAFDTSTAQGRLKKAQIMALIGRFWPGALTVVVKVREGALPSEFVAPDGTVALRMPASPWTCALAGRVGALPTTSANVHGAPAATKISQLPASFCAQCDLLVDAGAAPVGVASSIVDGVQPSEELRVLREGALSTTRLLEVVHAVSASS